MKTLLLLAACVLGACAGVRPDEQALQARRQYSPNVLYGEDLVRAGENNLLQAVASRVPGVALAYYRNGEPNLRIRGVNTLYGETGPLYVVNGMPLSRLAYSPLLVFNAHDIDRIEVLKSAGDTALYGINGGGGVVLIWTRGTNFLPD